MTQSKTSKHKTKAARVHSILKRAKGATLREIQSATLWQPHSCRAFLSRVRKQKDASLVKEERSSGQIAYRLVREEEACQS